ncbi:methionyl-tRNA formyltransferase [Aliishimia ponticola]|uniref:Methionyl-tRNA formyltransferase n=1 Tax=Aliishimia ponticola TaxID=2499833 RepID=A0A4S4N7E9_9RHOB|nr:methionyl-tRNA formyltransferase [Aliishimia ponticola]THH35066.1 methionyl-tRNA formyltransferase [Aliishimia ponticola]
MKLVFMGTPDFSVPVLEALVEAGHDVLCVYSQPPRPAGRGKKERLSPVQAKAEALGLPVRHPVSLKSSEAQAEFAALGAELAVVVAYGLLLPKPILDAPERGCLNIHASLLPRWRGAAPIHRAIMAGDTRTGVCIMQMEEGLDTGPVLLRKEIAIAPEDTTGTLHDKLSQLGAGAIVEALAALDDLVPQPQPDDGVTYAAKIDKAEARIDWTRPAAEVDRQIRGLSPFPGAWTEWQGARLKLLASRAEDGQGAPGDVLDDDLLIACGADAIRITRLQRAGKGAQAAAEFQRGAAITKGARL